MLTVPGVRLITLLRHPVRRMYSCWQHCFTQLVALSPSAGITKKMAESCGGTDFSTVLQKIFKIQQPSNGGSLVVTVRDRRSVAKSYRKAVRCVHQGNYAIHLAKYFATFNRTQMLVILHEHFIQDPFHTMQQVSGFGVRYYDLFYDLLCQY